MITFPIAFTHLFTQPRFTEASWVPRPSWKQTPRVLDIYSPKVWGCDRWTPWSDGGSGGSNWLFARIRKGHLSWILKLIYHKFTRENQSMKCILSIHSFTHLFSFSLLCVRPPVLGAGDWGTPDLDLGLKECPFNTIYILPTTIYPSCSQLGLIFPSRGHLTMSVTIWEGSGYWHLVGRGQGCYWTTHRTAPIIRNHLYLHCRGWETLLCPDHQF